MKWPAKCRLNQMSGSAESPKSFQFFDSGRRHPLPRTRVQPFSETTNKPVLDFPWCHPRVLKQGKNDISPKSSALLLSMNKLILNEPSKTRNISKNSNCLNYSTINQCVQNHVGALNKRN